MSDVRQNPGFPDGRISAADLDERLREVAGLPASPAAVGQLLALPDTPAPGAAAAMADIVRSDVALAAAALAAANRTNPRAAATIDEACRLLTPAGLRRLALTATLADQTPATDDGIDQAALRLHCLAVAHAARALAAEATPPVAPELAYTCGLLHDAGKLLLVHLFPRTYLHVLDSVRLGQGDLLEAERRILGLDHAIAGRRLARRWRLGEAVEETAWFSHQPPEALPDMLEHGPLVKLVGLADVIVREKNLGFSGNGAFTRSSGSLAEQLNIPASAVARAGEEAAAAAATREAASGLERIRGSGQRSLTRANAELGRTCEALGEQVAALQWQADALAGLQRLMLALPADAGVPDVLTHLARALADAAGAATPVIVYYAAPRAAQAVCIDGTNPPAWFPLEASSAPGAGESAAPAWAQRWFPAGAGRHAAILCGGQVVGGWVLPASAAADARVRQAIDALAPAAGVLLALAGERAAAVELGEALAGAAGNVARTQEALAQADALASLTALAAGAAHELNNPLAVISGRAQLLREKASDDAARRSCQIIVDQAQRISDMITSLMELASPPAPAPAAVEVGELLATSVRAFYSSKHPKAAASVVDIDCGQDTPPVLVDERQIRAVLVEAITNAATAGPDSPHVTLTAETDEANHAVILSVQDDGPGMDEQTKARVFTPFFSAQPAGRRPGMGLPRARRYVQANRGRIWIQTSQGDGTTVYVQLPQA